jgi:hypothetical protein
VRKCYDIIHGLNRVLNKAYDDNVAVCMAFIVVLHGKLGLCYKQNNLYIRITVPSKQYFTERLV